MRGTTPPSSPSRAWTIRCAVDCKPLTCVSVELSACASPPQIVIHVPFTQNVRLRSVLLKLGASSVYLRGEYTADCVPGRGELTPRRMRIYANRPNIVDFSEVEDITPHIDITLLEGETGVTEYPLRTAVFANVHSLSLFFVSELHSGVIWGNDQYSFPSPERCRRRGLNTPVLSRLPRGRPYPAQGRDPETGDPSASRTRCEAHRPSPGAVWWPTNDRQIDRSDPL